MPSALLHVLPCTVNPLSVYWTLLVAQLLFDTLCPRPSVSGGLGVLMVHGQLNLWADRNLVMRIIESSPSGKSSKSSSPTSLRCPRQRPDIQQRSEFLWLL